MIKIESEKVLVMTVDGMDISLLLGATVVRAPQKGETYLAEPGKVLKVTKTDNGGIDAEEIRILEQFAGVDLDPESFEQVWMALGEQVVHQMETAVKEFKRQDADKADRNDT